MIGNHPLLVESKIDLDSDTENIMHSIRVENSIKTMQSIGQLSVMWLFLFWCSVEGNRYECGEFNQWGKLSEETIDAESIFFQSLLGDFSSAVKSLRENEPYNFLGGLINDATATQISLSSDKLLKFVVIFLHIFTVTTTK